MTTHTKKFWWGKKTTGKNSFNKKSDQSKHGASGLDQRDLEVNFVMLHTSPNFIKLLSRKYCLANIIANKDKNVCLCLAFVCFFAYRLYEIRPWPERVIQSHFTHWDGKTQFVLYLHMKPVQTSWQIKSIRRICDNHRKEITPQGKQLCVFVCIGV